MKQLKSRKYKAIIFDIDGTLILNKKEGMPSKKVKKAIAKASEKIQISIATSRPLFIANHILEDISITAPSIITGGSQIYDPITKTIIKEYIMSKDSIETLRKTCKKLKIQSAVINEIDGDIKISNYKYHKPLQFWSGHIALETSDELFKEISKLKDISIFKITSWKKGYIDIIVADAKATKQHGILEISEILGIKPEEMIGVGDGYNDFPLLMACGLKVAMGNAVQELKEIADYIAPSVEEDGVVDIIERFVLNEQN